MVTGRKVGGYEILEELGRGAMGVVFKARQLSMDRIVAIKFLPKKLAQDERIVARFLREARAAGQLAHPNIVSVHELGLADGLHFIAMEYVDGNSIQKKIKDKGAYTEKDALDISVQIAEALKLAHSRGILHRDIKPDNFLIDSAGRVRLADLGLALIQSNPDGGLTQDGTTLGTPHFMSPEQCSGTNIDARSDLYSLGASMFVMATTRTPYEGSTAAAVMVRVLTEPPLSLKKIRPDLSAGYIALVEKMMHKDPEKRFQDAQSAVEAIQQCKSGHFKPVALPRSTPASPKSALPKPGASTSQDKTGTAIEKQSTRPQKGSDSKWMPLFLGGVAAFIFLGVLFFMSRGKNQPSPDQHTVAVVPTTSFSKPVTMIAETRTLVVGPKVPDDAHSTFEPKSERHRSAFLFLSEMADDFQKGKLKAADAQRKIQQFRKENDAKLMSSQALRRQTNLLEVDIQAKLKTVADDWRKLKPKVDADLRDDHIPEALAKLADFQSDSDGLIEATKAGERIIAICSGMLANAEKLAASGNYKEARTHLSITAKLPDKQDVAFKTAIAIYEEQIKLHQDLSDAYDRAIEKALYYDPVAKSRFQFLDAAKYCADYAAKPRGEPIRKDLLEIAELFKLADRVFTVSRSQLPSRPVDLPNIGAYSNVKVTQWDEKGLTYIPAKISLPQPFTWESNLAPNIVFQVVKELKKLDQDKLQADWDVGVLAFALGLQSPAGKIIREVFAKDVSPFKPQSALALKVLKPVDPSTVKLDRLDLTDTATASVTTMIEEDARRAFKDLQDAKKTDNKEKIKAIRADIDGKFATTDFVKANKKEIDELVPPVAVASVEPVKPPDPPKPAEKPKVADTVPPEEKEAHDLLKRLGWTEIVGTWVWDKANNAIRAEGLAEVGNPALESDVSVRFKLTDPLSKIRVLTRVEKGAVADRFAGMGGKTSLGFGADVNIERAFIYMDWQSKKGASKDPVPHGEVKFETRSYHTVDLSLHGNKLFCYVEGKEHKSSGDARSTGDTRVIVNGPVLFTLLKITNAK